MKQKYVLLPTFLLSSLPKGPKTELLGDIFH